MDPEDRKRNQLPDLDEEEEEAIPARTSQLLPQTGWIGQSLGRGHLFLGEVIVVRVVPERKFFSNSYLVYPCRCGAKSITQTHGVNDGDLLRTKFYRIPTGSSSSCSGASSCSSRRTSCGARAVASTNFCIIEIGSWVTVTIRIRWE